MTRISSLKHGCTPRFRSRWVHQQVWPSRRLMNLVVKARHRTKPWAIEEREGQRWHRELQATFAPTAESSPPGRWAPNFMLQVTPDQTLTLSDLLGRRVILALYPATEAGCGFGLGFSPVLRPRAAFKK